MNEPYPSEFRRFLGQEMMTEYQAMTSPLVLMNQRELDWVRAFCDNECRRMGNNAMGMGKYEKRMEEVMEEIERRKR